MLQEKFLDSLRALQPDLCLTAAYGNYLPTKFLSIPKFGTANIHPSLLPKYRGAAPVQRALQVSVAFCTEEHMLCWHFLCTRFDELCRWLYVLIVY